jgi:hypothetical protein
MYTPLLKEPPKKNKKVLPWIIGFGVGSVVVLVAILAIVFTRAPKHHIIHTRTLCSHNSSDIPVIGAACTEQCVEGAYCGTDKICHSGTALQIGDNCTTDSQCATGLYCPTGIQQCSFGGPGLSGDSCNTTSDCSIPYTCNSNTCGTVLFSQENTSCTKVSVYRIVNNTSFQLLESISSTLPNNWYYYPNSSPIWYGCNSGGTGLVPLYGWTKASTGDFMWSLSNTTLFIGTAGNQGYTVSNNPILYIYSSKLNNSMLPLYCLVGYQNDTNVTYHCSAVNTTTINGGWNSIVYNSLSGTIFDPASGTGILGYVYIS